MPVAGILLITYVWAAGIRYALDAHRIGRWALLTQHFTLSLVRLNNVGTLAGRSPRVYSARGPPATIF